MTIATKMTKAQLLAENARLREHCAYLEQRVGDALISKPAVPPVVAKPAVTKPAVSELDVLAAQCGFAPSTIRAIQPRRANGDIVSTYTKRDGTVWNKVQIGYNQYAHRPAV